MSVPIQPGGSITESTLEARALNGSFINEPFGVSLSDGSVLYGELASVEITSEQVTLTLTTGRSVALAPTDKVHFEQSSDTQAVSILSGIEQHLSR